jgi:hypothetical protein
MPPTMGNSGMPEGGGLPRLQMRRGLEQPLAELLDEYAKQAAHTDEVIATRDWDAQAVGRDERTGKPFALR